METVKVDVQKLQLLNDRIAQTIDALNQVRMSAHAIQHTQGSPWAAYGAGYGTQPVGLVPPFLQYGAQSPFSNVPYTSPFFGGIQHTATPYTNPYLGGTGTPFANPYLSNVTQVGSSIGAWPTSYLSNGISHSSFDPNWQLRAAQIFPFGQSPYPVSIG